MRRKPLSNLTEEQIKTLRENYYKVYPERKQAKQLQEQENVLNELIAEYDK